MEKLIKVQGKTGRLIEMADETGAYIICRNHQQAESILAQAVESDYHIPMPITYDEFIKGEYYGRGINGFLIDDVEELLQGLTNVPILAITINPNT